MLAQLGGKSVRPVGTGHSIKRVFDSVSAAAALVLDEEILTLLRKDAIMKVDPIAQLAGFHSTYFIVPKKRWWAMSHLRPKVGKCLRSLGLDAQEWPAWALPARAPSTCANYLQKWRVFSQGVTIGRRADSDRATSTIKVYSAAISFFHEAAGRHPLVSHFIRGVYRL